MEVKEAVKLKKELEFQILALLVEFQRKTGATPTSVYLNTVQAITVEQNAPQVHLVSVSVSAEL